MAPFQAWYVSEQFIYQAFPPYSVIRCSKTDERYGSFQSPFKPRFDVGSQEQDLVSTATTTPKPSLFYGDLCIKCRTYAVIGLSFQQFITAAKESYRSVALGQCLLFPRFQDSNNIGSLKFRWQAAFSKDVHKPELSCLTTINQKFGTDTVEACCFPQFMYP